MNTVEEVMQEVHTLLRFHAELGVANSHWELGTVVYEKILERAKIGMRSSDLFRPGPQKPSGRRVALLFGVPIVLTTQRFGINLISMEEACGS